MCEDILVEIGEEKWDEELSDWEGVNNWTVPNRTPMANALRSRIDKWDLMKLESFCKSKDIVNKTNWEIDWKKNSLTSHLIEG